MPLRRLTFVGLSTPDAGAQHIKGLPHYGYIENYPQKPTKEQIILVPPFEVVVVIYRLEGIDRNKSADPNDTTLFISVVNQETHQSYRGGLGITLISRDGVSEQRLDQPLEETVYRFRASIGDDPHDLTIHIEGPPAIVATGHIDLGAALNAWLVASLVVGVRAALVLAIIAGRRKIYLSSFRVRAADGR